MKLLFGWLLISSAISILIAINAPKIVPVGKATAEDIRVSTELYLLHKLLSMESLTKSNLQTLVDERQYNYKNIVIKSQFESLPVLIISLSLLFFNSLNIVFILLYVCYKKYKRRENTQNSGLAPIVRPIIEP